MARRKRRAAWGSVTYDPKGHVGRIRYWGKDADGTYRRMSCTVRGTLKDVERKRSELMLAHSEEAPCPTVGQVWENWARPAYERRVADGDMSEYTFRQYRTGWGKHAEPRWGDVQCDAVRPLHVQQWLDGLTYNGALQGMNVLRPLMDYAVRYGAVQTNPFRERYLMPSKASKSDMDKGVWTLDQLGEMWKVAHGQWWEGPFILSAFGGLRVGESLGVLCEDVRTVAVDGQRVCMAHVCHQMRSTGAEPSDRLKNAQSVRTVAIPGRAGGRLAEIAEQDVVWVGGDGLGNPSTQRRLMLAWKAACDNVDEGMRHPFRNLRNSWQTNARWSLRLPPWLVEPMMGHSVQGVTGQFYDRPQADVFAEVMADAYRERPYDEGWTWLDGPIRDANEQ